MPPFRDLSFSWFLIHRLNETVRSRRNATTNNPVSRAGEPSSVRGRGKRPLWRSLPGPLRGSARRQFGPPFRAWGMRPGRDVPWPKRHMQALHVSLLSRFPAYQAFLNSGRKGQCRGEDWSSLAAGSGSSEDPDNNASTFFQSVTAAIAGQHLIPQWKRRDSRPAAPANTPITR